MPIGFERIELVGDRVRLRPVRPADAAEAYRLITDDAVLATLLWEGPASVHERAAIFGRWQADLRTGDRHSFAIERADRPGIIGCIVPRLVVHPQQADLGYWLGVPYWNRDYMTEAVCLACHFSFEHLDAARAYATVMVGNHGSRRVLEKNGFRLDGTLRKHVLKRGEWRDEWFLTLLRSEWERAREGFLPRHEEIVPVEGAQTEGA
jgi:ribosomal-protein-alanine N-acetyltransferase